jgi:hypothetical protein
VGCESKTGGHLSPAQPTLYAMEEPLRRIRARHTASTITVYQAYSPEIGLPAARDGRFPAAWKRGGMTWIKPSFLRMMYRSGWGTKEGQETVLAVEITRDGFDWSLRHTCLSMSRMSCFLRCGALSTPRNVRTARATMARSRSSGGSSGT